MLVRDKVNEFLEQRMLKCNNIDEARRIIDEALPEIEVLAEQSSGRMQRFGWERNIFQIGYTRALCILRASMKRLL